MYFFPAVLFVCHALGMATAGDFWRNLKMSMCTSSLCVCVFVCAAPIPVVGQWRLLRYRWGLASAVLAATVRCIYYSC